MKKIIYAGLVFLLLLTGCAQKQNTTVNVEDTITEQTEVIKEEQTAVIEEKIEKTNDFINELAVHDAVRAKDFRLVIAADDNSGQINWTHSYFLYDR